MNVPARVVGLVVALLFTFFMGQAQPAFHRHFSAKQQICFAYGNHIARKPYDWSKIIRIDIDRKAWPGKYKVVVDILNSMAIDPAGQQIFENIASNNPGVIAIRDKEDLLNADNANGINSMFSADYGIQVIQRDMKYNAIDNELVLNFGKSGEMLSFDEQNHKFFKASLNSIIAWELEAAGLEQPEAAKNCRALLLKMNPGEKFLFDNYKDLMGEKFSAKDIEHCRGKKITIHSFTSNADVSYTFTDNVVDALEAFRDLAEMRRKNKYELESREMVLAEKYMDKLGEPHRSKEPVFNIKLGENRSRQLQFGPITGTDYIALSDSEQNVYKNFSVFYDVEGKQEVDNATALTRIKEEYTAQMKHSIEALNSPKMLEYVDRLKKYFNPDHKPTTNYQSVAENEVDKAMNNNPYLEGANKVIEAEIIWAEMKEMNKEKKKK